MKIDRHGRAKILTQAEIQLLFAEGFTLVPLRDRTLFALCLYTACRINECVTLHPTDVCGNTTYSRDYLGRNCQLPALEIGDIIAILDVGAYGYAMSSHFLHRPRPAKVLLENGTHRLIRKREDYRILLENQLVDAKNID